MSALAYTIGDSATMLHAANLKTPAALPAMTLMLVGSPSCSCCSFLRLRRQLGAGSMAAMAPGRLPSRTSLPGS